MKLTKEQLEMLSDCVLAQMGAIRQQSEALFFRLEIEKLLEDKLLELKEINHIICNELKRITE